MRGRTTCEEPGCQLRLGHDGMHFRREADGDSEWGNFPKAVLDEILRCMDAEKTGTDG